MSTIALNNLLTYILSLGLSSKNKKWLADRLIESDQATTRLQQEQMIKNSLTTAIREMKEAKVSGKKLQSADELLEEMKEW